MGEKTRKRTNRKEQRMKKREDYVGKFGIFVGKIPKGVTREDLGSEFSKLNVPVPDYVDWVVKKGHAFAFWQEEHAGLSLEVFTGITVQDVTLEVELYDTNRMRIKEERRRKEQEEAGDAKTDDEGTKKPAPRRSTKSESERRGKESQNGVKTEKAKPEEDVKTKPATPKKTASPKGSEEEKSAKTPAKEATRTPVKKAPETPTKTKTSESKSPPKPKEAKVASPSQEGAPAEGGKENCSIS